MQSRSSRAPGGRVELPGQLEFPQTEPQPAALAKRLAAGALRPRVPQQPCDLGLFSSQKDQIGLDLHNRQRSLTET